MTRELTGEEWFATKVALLTRADFRCEHCAREINMRKMQTTYIDRNPRNQREGNLQATCRRCQFSYERALKSKEVERKLRAKKTIGQEHLL